MSRCLITGATGFIGRHLVDHLLNQGHELVLLVREQYAGQPLPPALARNRPRFDLVYADLRSQNLVIRAVREAASETVIHLAAAGATDPFLNPETAVRHNMTGTINLLRACFEKTTGVERLVMARTPGELTHMNVYAASKLAAWIFCQMYANSLGWPIVGGMIFQCFGPGQESRALVPSAIQAAQNNQDFPMTAGTQVRDWIYVEDVAAGLAAAAVSRELAPGESVDLGRGVGTSVADVVRLIYRLTNSQGKPLIGRLPTRPGEVDQQLANLPQTAAKIGWRPVFNLEEGLRRTLLHTPGWPA